MNVKKKILRKPLPVIFGIKGYKLNDREKIFFKKTNPLGFIFFERNCKNKKQVKSLVDNLKNLLSHDKAFFLIDQEGGRVSRLNNPIWKKYPTAKYFGDLYKINNGKVSTVDVNENNRVVPFDLVKDNVRDIINQLRKFYQNILPQTRQ